MEEKEKHINKTFLEIKKYINNGGLEYSLMPELLKAELACSLNISEDDVLRAILKMTKENIDINYESFKANRKNILLGKKKSKFIFYSFVNYSLVDTVSLNGKEIKKISKENEQIIIDIIIKHNAHTNLFIEYANLSNDGFYFIETQIESFDFTNAYKEYYSVYSLLKSILEFVVQFGSWTSFFGNNKRILARLPHTPFIFCTNDEVVTFVPYYDHYTTNLKQHAYNEKKQSFAKKLFDVFKNKFEENDLRFLLAESFRLYNSGIDNLYREYRFLFLWNALEKFTLSEKTGGKTEEVIKRLKPFIKQYFFDDYSSYVKHLIKLRNDLVHDGINAIDDLSVNVLKFFLESCFAELVQKIDKLPTIKHLEQYYRIWTKNKNDLNVIKEVVDARIIYLNGTKQS